MPGFSSYDDAIAETTQNGKIKPYTFSKITGTMQGAGFWHSLWRLAGLPGAGADPATTPGTQYNNTAGSINFQDEASDYKFLTSFGALSTANCTLMLYDRLVGVSGIALTSTGNKTINSSALLRYASTAAIDVQCWLEVTTASTTTAAVVSLNSYTDEAGNTGNSGATRTFPAAATVQNTLVGPLPISNADKGIRSIEVGLNVGTATTNCVVNVLLIRPLAFLPLLANIWNEKDFLLPAPTAARLFDGASLGIAALATATATMTVQGQVLCGWG